MRGKRWKGAITVVLTGITPACAGKTQSAKRIFISVKDHPRVCGENGGFRRELRPFGGSPPRVRGKPLNFQAHICVVRITPACAGKTRVSFGTMGKGKDHPRVCGENCLDNANGDEWLGSPPRVRGKPGTALYPGVTPRITPACAGKTDESALEKQKK